MSGTGWRWILLAAAAACAVSLWRHLDFGAQPEVSRFRDDAYYYFVWARNLAAGAGPVVSDGTWTSGVHPLWGLLLAGVAALFGPAAIPGAAHALGLGLHAATAALWLRQPGALAPRAALALLYLGNPFLLREAQNGQETALAMLLLLLLWQARRSGVMAFSVLGLLLVLARSDLWAAFLLLALWRDRRTGWLPPLLVLACHLALNRLLGGGWLQDSAAPMPWLMHHNFLATGPDFGDTLRRAWWYLRPVLLGGPWAVVEPVAAGALVFVLLRPLWPRRFRLAPLAAVALAVPWASDLLVPGIAALLLALFPRRRPGRPPADLAALALSLAAVMVLHYVLRQYPRNYYFAPMGIAGLAALWRLRRLGLLLLASALSQAGSALLPPQQWPGQEEMAMAGRFLRHVLPPGEAVGCFNAGLVSWYHDGPVVNLDGVVDHRAFAALRRGELSRFLDEQGIRFVVDNPVQFSRDPRIVHANGLWFGPDFDPAADLREVARFDVPGVDAGRPETDSFRLYWRVGRGQPPATPKTARLLAPAPGAGFYVLWPGRPGVTLSIGRDPGSARPLLVAEAATCWVLRVPAAAGATALWASDRREPELALQAR